MRAQEFITEWRDSHLYHATTWGGAINIWREGAFRQNTSFTRMWTYAAGYAQGMSYASDGRVIFALDADKLRREFGRRNLFGYDWFQANNPSDAGEYRRRDWFDDTDRAEERNRLPIPLKKYLAQVDVWMPVIASRKPEMRNVARKAGQRYVYSDWNNYTLDAGVERALQRPETKAVWDDMTRDPRVKIHPLTDPGIYQQGVEIDHKLQYDHNHPAYGGDYE